VAPVDGDGAAAVELRASGGGCRGGAKVAAKARRARAGEDGVARLRAGARGGDGAAARRARRGHGESVKTTALGIGEYGRRWMKRKTERDLNVRLKRGEIRFLRDDWTWWLNDRTR
jgi:hypothetical protein